MSEIKWIVEQFVTYDWVSTLMDDSNLNGILQYILDVVILFMSVVFISYIIQVIFTMGGR